LGLVCGINRSINPIIVSLGLKSQLRTQLILATYFTSLYASLLYLEPMPRCPLLAHNSEITCCVNDTNVKPGSQSGLIWRRLAPRIATAFVPALRDVSVREV